MVFTHAEVADGDQEVSGPSRTTSVSSSITYGTCSAFNRFESISFLDMIYF